MALLAAAVPPAAIAAPLAVHAHFDDATVQFGDVIRAHVAVVIDPTAVRSGSVHVAADLAPLTSLGPQRIDQTGDVTELTRVATCSTAPCVGARGEATPKLRPVSTPRRFPTAG